MNRADPPPPAGPSPAAAAGFAAHGLGFDRVSMSRDGQRVLSDISLTVGRGEMVVIVGASGSGKSTLLRLAAGLETPDAGRIVIDGAVVNDTPPAARDVAMVFQDFALYPHMTVFQNMALPLLMRRLSWLERLPVVGALVPGRAARLGEVRAEVDAAAGRLGLTPLLRRFPGQLSGGQRQRTALGRALVRQPRVFLMDEPLSSLDAGLRHQLRREIVDLQRQLGATCLYVTHDQTEAMTMGDRVAVMADGRLVQVGPPEAIYQDPEHIAVLEVIGAPKANLFRGADLVGDLRGGGGPGPGVWIGIRPEHVSPDGPDAPEGPRLGVRQLKREYDGREVVNLGQTRVGGLPVSWIERERAAGTGAAADEVDLVLPAARLWRFAADGGRVRP